MASQVPAAPAPAESNSAGLIGFVLSLVGIAICVAAPIGMIVSMVGLRREPKGLAIAGTIIGLVLTILYGVILAFYGAMIMACVGIGAAMGPPIQTEANLTQARQRIKDYREENNQLPTEAVAGDLLSDLKDGWDREIRYELDEDGTDYTVRSAGPDGEFDTGDDQTQRGSDPFFEDLGADDFNFDDSSMIDDSGAGLDNSTTDADDGADSVDGPGEDGPGGGAD